MQLRTCLPARDQSVFDCWELHQHRPAAVRRHASHTFRSRFLCQSHCSQYQDTVKLSSEVCSPTLVALRMLIARSASVLYKTYQLLSMLSLLPHQRLSLTLPTHLDNWRSIAAIRGAVDLVCGELRCPMLEPGRAIQVESTANHVRRPEGSQKTAIKQGQKEKSCRRGKQGQEQVEEIRQ